MAAAADASSWAASRSAARSRARARALATGDPASRAIPSLAWSRWGRAPRSARAAPASRTAPPGPMTRPAPTRVWKAWASGITSPAQPTPRRGTAGTKPSLTRSTRNRHSSGPTPAWPLMRLPSRATSSARASAASSHGGPPTARPSSRLRWWSPVASRPRSTEASQPAPVVTPSTRAPPASSAASPACPAATRSRAAGARDSGSPPQATASTASLVRSRCDARVIMGTGRRSGPDGGALSCRYG